jgi:hypothetical protein
MEFDCANQKRHFVNTYHTRHYPFAKKRGAVKLHLKSFINFAAQSTFYYEKRGQYT